MTTDILLPSPAAGRRLHNARRTSAISCESIMARAGCRMLRRPVVCAIPPARPGSGIHLGEIVVAALSTNTLRASVSTPIYTSHSPREASNASTIRCRNQSSLAQHDSAATVTVSAPNNDKILHRKSTVESRRRPKLMPACRSLRLHVCRRMIESTYDECEHIRCPR